MYIDKVLVPRYLIPPIDYKICQFFREEEEGFIKSFFFIFTFAESIEQVYEFLDADLSDVDFVQHDLDNWSYDIALNAVVENYVLFHKVLNQHIGMVRKPPLGVSITLNDVDQLPDKTYLLTLEVEHHIDGQDYSASDFIITN